MFKKHMTTIGKKGSVVNNVGKGASEQTLPSRGAMQTLTAGNVADRTMQNYGKASPPVGGPSNTGATPQYPLGNGNSFED